MRLLKLKNINTEYRYIAIFAIIMSLQMFFIDPNTFPSTQYEGDQSGYFTAANSLYSSFGMHNIRPLGYPIFLGLPNLFGFKTPFGYWHVILNVLFFIATLITVKKIGDLLNYRLVFGVGIGLCFSTGYMLQLTKALTETGFVFFILLGIYNAIRYIKRRNRLHVFMIFLSLGFATLFRPGFLYLFFLLLILTLIYLIMSLNKTHIIYVILGMVLTIGVQSAFMKKQFDTYKISYIDDITWYLYGSIITVNISEDCYRSHCYNEIYNRRDSFIKSKFELYPESVALKEISHISKKDRYDLLREKPKSIFKMLFYNIKNNLITGTNQTSGTHLVKYYKLVSFVTQWTNIILTTIPLIMFTLLFLIKLIKNEAGLLFCLLTIFILYSILTSGISAFQGDRFHVAFYPISLLMITIFIQKIRLLKNA